MSLGKFVFDGDLEAEIFQIELKGGQIVFTAQSGQIKAKQIPEGPGKIPVLLYGGDGMLVAMMKQDVSCFGAVKAGDFMTYTQHIDLVQITVP